MNCMYSEKGLELEVAIKILENVDSYSTIDQPPMKPKGGEVFLFLPKLPNEQENYKCDQYRWLNSGPKEIPRKNPLVRKQYFIGKLPEGKTQAFQKHCYILVGETRSPYPVLLHYIGDETVMVDYPHGNSKKSNSTYFATAPSVRKDIANRSKTSMPTSILNSYNSNISTSKSQQDINPVLTPRNKSQVRNIRRKQIKGSKEVVVSSDDLDTLYCLSSEMEEFVHYLQTWPELICIIGLTDVATEVENLLKLSNDIVGFSFHEYHKVGKYYVMPLYFMHNAFSEMPAIPSHFMISEVFNYDILKRYLHTVIDCIPILEEITTTVITNQDLSITSVIADIFPLWRQVYDWELLFTHARTFLRKLNIEIKDISLRIKQLRSLMNAESYEDYVLELSRYQKDWPPPFFEFYAGYLKEPVETRLGRWLLERCKLYSPHLGVYQGINEEVNLVIKNLQELRNISIDVILPTLYHLQVYLHANVKKSFCNVGRYSLCSSFRFLQQDIDDLVLPQILEPSEIVKIFRVRGITLFSENKNNGLAEDENTLLQAKEIVEMNNISHSSSLKAFLVKSPTGSLHGVQIYPRETCSCSLNQRCAHILAVLMSLGMPITYDKKGKVKVLKPQVATNFPNGCIDMAIEQQMKEKSDVEESITLLFRA